VFSATYYFFKLRFRHENKKAENWQLSPTVKSVRFGEQKLGSCSKPENFIA
jgi:hypothetical protein